MYWFVFNRTFIWLINSWLHNPFYTHGLIIVGICLLLLVYNGFKIKKIRLNLNKSILLFIIALIFAIAGAYYRFQYLIALAYSFFCVAITRNCVDRVYIHYVQIPLLLMILVYPLPFQYEISGFFAFLTTKVAVFILSICFSSIIVNGIDITIPPDVQFSIGLNCGGANSILALITIVIIWLLVFKNKPTITYILIACVLPMGFFTNVFRIIGIFLIAKMAGMDAAEAAWHDFSGYFFHIVSLSGMFLIWLSFAKMYHQNFMLRRLILR